MLDPFSAISLACAIVQFVDFGSKIIDTGHEAYRNSNGTTQEYADLEELTTSLYKFQDKFANTGSPNDAATRSADQRSLDELARKCSYVAGDILILLEDLKVKETGSLRTWDSLRQACRSVRKRERIQELQRSLEKISAQINSRLLYMIRYVKHCSQRHAATTRLLIIFIGKSLVCICIMLLPAVPRLSR